MNLRPQTQENLSLLRALIKVKSLSWAQGYLRKTDKAINEALSGTGTEEAILSVSRCVGKLREDILHIVSRETARPDFSDIKPTCDPSKNQGRIQVWLKRQKEGRGTGG
jgi:hypothetical protein